MSKRERDDSIGNDGVPFMMESLPDAKRGRTRDEVIDLLKRPLGPEFVSTRAGPAGVKLSYLEGHDAFWLANEIFGNDGWESEIRDKTIQVDRKVVKDGGRDVEKYTADVTCFVKVTVTWPDGRRSSHEDVGFGGGKPRKGSAEAIQEAVKEAVTDGKKRALKNFGESLGNCLYDKTFLKWIEQTKNREKGKFTRGQWDLEDLMRLPCNVARPGGGDVANTQLVVPPGGMQQRQGQVPQVKSQLVIAADDFEEYDDGDDLFVQ